MTEDLWPDLFTYRAPKKCTTKCKTTAHRWKHDKKGKSTCKVCGRVRKDKYANRR